jgi:prolyl oligopeptidase
MMSVGPVKWLLEPTKELVVANEHSDDEPYLWLEAVDDPNALAWVRGMNGATQAKVDGIPGHAALRDRLVEILESDERLVFPAVYAGLLYDFRQDAAHQRGVWRRCTWPEFRAGDAGWETVLDLDALAEQEGESWVWKGAVVCMPAAERALVKLSRGGGDAVVIREFDLIQQAFADQGFVLPEAKSRVSWLDGDTVLVQTDTGPESLTTSGYPRTVRRWQRGQMLEQAEEVFSAPVDHVSAWAAVWRGPGRQVTLYGSNPDFFTNQVSLEVDGVHHQVDKPDSASLSLFGDHLLLELRESWEIAGTTYAAGSLLAFDRAAYLAGERSPTVLFEPDEWTSLSGHTTTASQLVLTVLDQVVSRLHVWTVSAEGAWQREEIAETAAVTLYADAVDSETSDGWLLLEQGYLQPHRLMLAGPGGSGRCFVPALIFSKVMAWRSPRAWRCRRMGPAYRGLGSHEPMPRGRSRRCFTAMAVSRSVSNPRMMRSSAHPGWNGVVPMWSPISAVAVNSAPVGIGPPSSTSASVPSMISSPSVNT